MGVSEEKRSEIESEMRRLADKIAIPEAALPGYDRFHEGIHIEHDGMYHWVVVERGVEIVRRTTLDFDEFLFWVFESISNAIATRYAMKHRVSGEDFRRKLFSKQLELLGRLSSEWKSREENTISKILESNPFRDQN